MKQKNTWTWPIIDALRASSTILVGYCDCGDIVGDCQSCFQAKENRRIAKHLEDNFGGKSCEEAALEGRLF